MKKCEKMCLFVLAVMLLLALPMAVQAEEEAVVLGDYFLRRTIGNAEMNPVTLTEDRLGYSALTEWIVYYLYSGGPTIIEREVLQYVNRERMRAGVAPVQLCNVLAMAARFKAQEMVDLQYFDHRSPVYGANDRIPVALLGAYNFAADNLIRGHFQNHVARTMVHQWMASPHTRANILAPEHTTMGVGVLPAVYGTDSLLGVQLFGYGLHTAYFTEMQYVAEDNESLFFRFDIEHFDTVFFLDSQRLRQVAAPNVIWQWVIYLMTTHDYEYEEDALESAVQHIMYTYMYGRLARLLTQPLQAGTAYVFTAVCDLQPLPIRITPIGSEVYDALDARTYREDAAALLMPDIIALFTRGIIPPRRLTPEEIEGWIAVYEATGGANAFELEVIRLTNIHRANAGLPLLQVNNTLMMAARFKSHSMYDLNYFAHDNPVYGYFYNIARQVFGFPIHPMGENIASFHQTPEQVVRDWMRSPGHRANILSPTFIQIGIGFYNYRWTQKFSGIRTTASHPLLGP